MVYLQTPPVAADSLVIDVKRRLDSEGWQGLVVVEKDVPVGLIMKASLNQQLSGQYGVSLYYSRPVQMVMDKFPLIVDAESSLEKVAALAQSRPEEKLYDLIVVIREGKYSGTVSVMDLVKHLADIRIQLAANANPLTGLAGNRVIDDKIRLSVTSKRPFAALYLDLDNFKAFNDKYGFERGDAAIKLTANILKEVTEIYGEQDAFVGHIGGDDFIILLSHSVPSTFVAEQIIRKFDSEIRSLYFSDDLVQRCIVVFNRKGNREEFPIMSISIAIVNSCCNQFANHLEVAEVAAGLKRRAKSIEGSVWVNDRRTQHCSIENGLGADGGQQ
jgi:diguanylate cyclase (GGDEF)-like protein